MTRPVVGLAIAAIAVFGGARTVSAHIDPDPKEAPAGSVQIVGFTVEHGCEGSATIQLDMRLPDGVTDAVPEPLAGWTADVSEGVVTFVGGPLPDDVEGTFRVRMTLPMASGTTIYFPFVQRCEQGEIRWIDIPSDGSGTELDEPAPAMNLLAPLPTTSTTAPPTTAPPTTRPPSTTAPATTVTTAAPPTTAGPATTTTSTTETATTAAAPTSAASPATDGGEDDRGSGRVVVAGTAAAVAAATGLTIWQVRRRRP